MGLDSVVSTNTTTSMVPSAAETALPDTDTADGNATHSTFTRLTANPTQVVMEPSTFISEPCELQCNNGGVCVRVSEDCGGPAAPKTKEVCDCNPDGMQQGTCGCVTPFAHVVQSSKA